MKLLSVEGESKTTQVRKMYRPKFTVLGPLQPLIIIGLIIINEVISQIKLWYILQFKQ